MTTAEIRTNWAAALESNEDSSMLSASIGFGFTKDDLRELAALHQAGKYQEKIEALLVECNFISFLELHHHLIGQTPIIRLALDVFAFHPQGLF